METRIFAAVLSLVLALASMGPARAVVSESLRDRLEASRQGFTIMTMGASFSIGESLRRWYEERAFQPAWFEGGLLGPHGRELLHVLQRADEHGLYRDDYHLATLADWRRRVAQGGDAVADLDLLLSHAALDFADHLLHGRLRPVDLFPDWQATPPELDLVKFLVTLHESDPDRVAELYAGLEPEDPRYGRLSILLQRLRQTPPAQLPRLPGMTLRRGDRDATVSILRARLALQGLLPAETPPDADLFDEAVDAAVRAFQKGHGLEPDGIVGPLTNRAVNTDAAERSQQVRANLERWRWLPRQLGERRVEVNIAGFSADVFENGHAVMNMRAIVGTRYHKSPMFSGRMTYLVLNPSWHVPPSIAVNEILPRLRRDPEYLERQDMRVLKGWGADRIVVDGAGMDWSRVSAKRFPYRFQQMPGEKNALGRIKFMFPNSYNVYMHDTPAQRLFLRTTRDFSHGCIRINKPLELALYLLRDDREWMPERVQATLAGGRETTVKLRHPLPVHLLYWTVWVDEQGTPQFRADHYDRDQRVIDALNQLEAANSKLLN